MNAGMSGTLCGAELDYVTQIAGGGLVPDRGALREEFEDRLVSPFGLHRDPTSCARWWDEAPWSESELRRQIAAATAWLRREPTRRPNRNIGTSYHLKHLCEDWFRASHGGSVGYTLNGCFIMAALRLGLEVEVPAAFVWGARDFYNPYVSISTRSVEALRREVETKVRKLK